MIPPPVELVVKKFLIIKMLTKTNQYTQQDLKIAYQIVQQDLFNSLLKAKNGQSIHFGKLGKLTKKECQQKCG